jgi:SAM-dependent methyltransferase
VKRSTRAARSVNDDAAGVATRRAKLACVTKAGAWNSGDAYEPYVGRWSRRLAPTFLGWAQVSAGWTLDVGCGTGALSQALIDRSIHPVVGIDPSAEYVAYASAHVTKGTSRASFLVGDATALPFDATTFNTAVSGLVLNFVSQPLLAVREMRRVVHRHGAVACYVWDYAGTMELMRYFWDAAVELDPQRAGTFDEGIRFPICRPDHLTTLFRDGGLKEIATTSIDVATVFRDFNDYWHPFLGGQGAAPRYAMSLDLRRREHLRDLIQTRIAIRSDGNIHLIARAWAVKGTRT